MGSEERSERPERSDRPDRGEGGPRGGGGGGGGRRFGGNRRKVCRFCAEHIPGIDYKDVSRLRSYISERGKIEPRRKTGTCLKHQRLVATAVKRARHLALVPYTLEHVRRTGIFPVRG